MNKIIYLIGVLLLIIISGCEDRTDMKDKASSAPSLTVYNKESLCPDGEEYMPIKCKCAKNTSTSCMEECFECRELGPTNGTYIFELKPININSCISLMNDTDNTILFKICENGKGYLIENRTKEIYVSLKEGIFKK